MNLHVTVASVLHVNQACGHVRSNQAALERFVLHLAHHELESVNTNIII